MDRGADVAQIEAEIAGICAAASAADEEDGADEGACPAPCAALTDAIRLALQRGSEDGGPAEPAVGPYVLARACIAAYDLGAGDGDVRDVRDAGSVRCRRRCAVVAAAALEVLAASSDAIGALVRSKGRSDGAPRVDVLSDEAARLLGSSCVASRALRALLRSEQLCEAADRAAAAVGRLGRGPRARAEGRGPCLAVVFGALARLRDGRQRGRAALLPVAALAGFALSGAPQDGRAARALRLFAAHLGAAELIVERDRDRGCAPPCGPGAEAAERLEAAALAIESVGCGAAGLAALARGLRR